MAIQTLTREEICGLTRALGTVAVQSANRHEVRDYDLTRPARMRKTTLRTAEKMLAALARTWSETAGDILKEQTSVRIGSAEEMDRDDYVSSLPRQCAVFTAKTGEGSLVSLSVPVDLATKVANRMAGGRGEIHQRRSRLTHIEQIIVSRFVSRLCDDLVSPLGLVQRMSVSASAAPEVSGNTLIVAGVDLRIGAVEHTLDLAVSPDLLESLADRPDTGKSTKEQTTSNLTPQMLESMLGSVPVPVTADLGHARVTMQEVRGMEVGDVIRLDRLVGEPIPINVGKQMAYLTQPGLVGNQVAVKISPRAE